MREDLKARSAARSDGGQELTEEVTEKKMIEMRKMTGVAMMPTVVLLSSKISFSKRLCIFPVL